MYIRQISLIILLCGILTSNLTANVDTHPTKAPNAIFDADFNTVLYKAGVQVYDSYFSGIFLFKKDSAQSYRIVFLNEFGLTLLDYSYSKGNFTLNSCKEFLNKKMVLKQIESDVEILLQSFPEDVKIKSTIKDGLSGIRFRYKHNKYFYFCNKEQKPERIEIKKGILNRTFVTLGEFQEGLPQTLDILHKPVKLKFSFTKIKQE